MFQRTEIKFVHESVLHDFLSGQIFCCDMVVLIHALIAVDSQRSITLIASHDFILWVHKYSTTTLSYQMFSTVAHINIYHLPIFVYFGYTNTYRTCSKKQKSILCMNQCFIITWVHKYSATTLPYHIFSTVAHITIYHSPTLFILDVQMHIKHVPKNKNQLCAWISFVIA